MKLESLFTMERSMLRPAKVKIRWTGVVKEERLKSCVRSGAYSLPLGHRQAIDLNQVATLTRFWMDLP